MADDVLESVLKIDSELLPRRDENEGRLRTDSSPEGEGNEQEEDVNSGPSVVGVILQVVWGLTY